MNTYTPDDLYDMFANQADAAAIAATTTTSLAMDLEELDTDGTITDYYKAAEQIKAIAAALAARSAAAAAMGRAKSERKATASRENGKHGGRPVTVYELDHEWSGWKITKTSTAWIYTQWSRVQGTRDGLKMRLPFSEKWPANLDLTEMWNDAVTVGERLAEEIKYGGSVLDYGSVVQ